MAAIIRKFKITITEHGGEYMSQDFDIESKVITPVKTLMDNSLAYISDYEGFRIVNMDREIIPI